MLEPTLCAEQNCSSLIPPDRLLRGAVYCSPRCANRAKRKRRPDHTKKRNADTANSVLLATLNSTTARNDRLKQQIEAAREDLHNLSDELTELLDELNYSRDQVMLFIRSIRNLVAATDYPITPDIELFIDHSDRYFSGSWYERDVAVDRWQ